METDWLLAQEFLESHARDAALVLERLPAGDAAALLENTSPHMAAGVLEQMAPMTAAECLACAAPEPAGAILAALSLDFAAGLLRRVESDMQERLLAHSPSEVAAALRRLLQYPEGTAGALMDPQALAFPGDVTVNEVLRRIRRSPEHVLYYFYIVDRDQKLIGVLSLRELMLASPETPLASVMHTHMAQLQARADLSSIVVHPGWREYHALPVVDNGGTFLGVIRYETLRRLEDDTTGRRPANQALSTMFSIGELCWIGFGGILAGLAATTVPRVIEEHQEADHGAKR